MLVFLSLLTGLEFMDLGDKSDAEASQPPSVVFVLFCGCSIILDGGEERSHQI